MNPFDLRGPAFLAFYLLASAGGLVFLYLAARGVVFGPQRAASVDARKHLRDPYLVAYLRGGVREVIHTLVFALHQRTLLTNAKEHIVAVGGRSAREAVQHPLELALILQCGANTTMEELIKAVTLRAAIENYAEPLRESGLVADEAEKARRKPAFLAVAGTLAALSVIKILLALQRGHSNIVLLVILTLIVLAACYAIYRSPKTNAGRRALADQQTLFTRLKSRVARMAADGATNEAVLVAATFGLDALPGEAYPFAAMLHKQTRQGSSSCSSGCGSSCGGGGCGGGCGGCGS